MHDVYWNTRLSLTMESGSRASSDLGPITITNLDVEAVVREIEQHAVYSSGREYQMGCVSAIRILLNHCLAHSTIRVKCGAEGNDGNH